MDGPAQLAEQNQVCFPTPLADFWSGYRHYVFTFHDTTFECIAEGLTLTLSQEPHPEVLRDLLERLMRREPAERYARERSAKRPPGER